VKLHKFSFFALAVTFFCLAYVYQQTQIYCLAYTGGKKEQLYQDLLDKNNLLRYNLNVITSLPLMGGRVLGSCEFEMLAISGLMRLEEPKAKENLVKSTNKFFTRLGNIFSLKSQAEATPLNRQ